MAINITLRSTKGSQLTAAEVDTNFTNIKDAITATQAMAGVTSVNGRTGAVIITQSDVVSALGYTPSSGGSGTGGGGTGTSTTGVAIGATNPATGTEGAVFYNTTDGLLYVYHNGAWVSASTVITPNASSGVAIVSSLPGTGIAGAVIYNTTDSKLYQWNGSAWAPAAPTISGTQITDGSISTPKLAANSITSGQIAANAIISGKIAAGAIGATELAAGAVTAGKLAAGAVTAGTIAAGAITATNIAAGAISADKLTSSTSAFTMSGVNYWLGGNNLIYGSPVCMLVQQTGNTIAFVTEGINAPNGQCPAFFLTGQQSDTVALSAYSGVSQHQTNPDYWTQTLLSYNSNGTRCGVQASVASAGVAGNFLYYNTSTFTRGVPMGSPTRIVQICNSSYGVQLFGSTVGAFTGAHDGLYPDNAPDFEVGDIVVDGELVGTVTINDGLTRVSLSDAPRMKTVIGIVSSERNKDHVPSALAKPTDQANGDGSISAKMAIDPQYADLVNTHSYITVNALGEGGINVCGENGDIEAGDLIVTSSMPGKGMKQDDDIVRSITVAKARQSVKFSSPTEVKFIACIYMCG